MCCQTVLTSCKLTTHRLVGVPVLLLMFTSTVGGAFAARALRGRFPSTAGESAAAHGNEDRTVTKAKDSWVYIFNLRHMRHLDSATHMSQSTTNRHPIPTTPFIPFT